MIKSNSYPSVQCEIEEGQPSGHSDLFLPHFLCHLLGTLLVYHFVLLAIFLYECVLFS